MGEPSLDDSNVKVAVRVRPMNRRESLDNKGTVSHKSSFTLQWFTQLYSRFPEQERKAQMTFPGCLPSWVCAVGYHVSSERRQQRQSG
ncbi:hypothetical protein CHARACLAT_019353 [Characodon lateralis]|uniref:Kinesin motor domain-containing protein n=1 Tax=Characodon lateralis TaxID=208331 RepID=A0ABU7EW65_9TELE|nr:hypothetical protein [Characodon lateralis]